MKVTVRRRIAASPDRVWAVVGDFAGCAQWCPVDSCTATGNRVGSMRTVRGMGLVCEQQLTALDDKVRLLNYTMTDNSELPWADYRAEITVSEVPGGSEVTWVCELRPLTEEAHIQDRIRRTYEPALETLARLVES
jgi:mxaD protein